MIGIFVPRRVLPRLSGRIRSLFANIIEGPGSTGKSNFGVHARRLLADLLSRAGLSLGLELLESMKDQGSAKRVVRVPTVPGSRRTVRPKAPRFRFRGCRPWQAAQVFFRLVNAHWKPNAPKELLLKSARRRTSCRR